MSPREVSLFLGFVAAVSMLLVYLKSANPALFGAVLAGASAVFAAFVMDKTAALIANFGGYLSDIGSEGLSAVIKGVYISVSSEIVSSLCRDNGLSAFAVKAEMAARIALVSLALPLIAELFSLLEGL